MKAFLEIACFNLNDAFSAVNANADRIEFCSDYLSGGLTPNKSEFQQLRKSTETPIFVMIRPRKGDFNYNENEFQQMLSDTRYFMNEGADGIVYGILNDKKQIDYIRTEKITHQCRGIQYTFHRAFDHVENKLEAIYQLNQMPINYLLSSGGAGNAENNVNSLIEIKTNLKAKLIVGGGIRANNLKTINDRVNSEWYHSAALIQDKSKLDALEIESMKSILNS